MPATTRTIAAAMTLLLAGLCLAGPRADLRPVPAGTTPLVSSAALQRAEVDTVFLLGDPRNADQSPQHNGTFEDADGTPDWAGWTTWNADDIASDPRWQVSEFQALAGQYSMWCGDHFDGDPGYGNDWNTALLFTHTVADPSVATTVRWTASLRVDTEPDYDFVHLEWCNGGAWWPLQQFDGNRFYDVDETITYEPGQYVGDDLDEVQLRVRFTSDNAWSDEDGLWLTDGACQYDDVRVLVDGVEVDVEDFEDGVSQRWSEARAAAYWDLDFARLWTDLEDLDPCVDNASAQVAFIDTGEQSIHTDGTPCITWCYGPGGYIAYNSNAFGNPSVPLNNAVISPVLEWPAGCDAAQLDLTAYLHEDLGPASPQVFARWHVRSVDTGLPGDLTSAEWRSRNYLYYGGPEYRRMQFDVSDLLEPGRTHVQVILQAFQFEIWGWGGADGTPAPYFDNVQLKAYPRPEPVITAMADHLFHDAVPTTGVVDLGDLAANSVRLDASRVTNEGVPVDSIQVDIAVLRPDAVLAEPARLHVRMLANPLFDSVRQLPTGFTQSGAVVTGSVAGTAQDTRVRFDLPDHGFFFPGDVIRCYVRAVSEVDGVQHPAILPADTAGFGSDQRHAGYCEAFEVRALPTIADASGAQPHILFWQHGHGDQGQRWWLDTFAAAGRQLGVDVDLYAANAPGLEDADGLGGRVPASALAGYDILVYAGNRLRIGLSAHPEWDDVAVLTEWIEQGSKRILLTGDNVVRSLDGWSAGSAFMSDYLGAVFEADDVAPLIGQQQSPLVLVPAPGPIWRPSLEGWLVDGGCPEPRQIDAVTPGPGAASFAGFADPSGAPDAYPYTAAWYHPNPVHDTLAVGLPYDLRAVAAAPGFPVPPGQSAAAVLLDDILDHLGGIISGVGSVPATSLAVHCFPNPFNPAVTIRLEVPRGARATVDIVDVRGRHVRRIVQADLAAGLHDLTWDGADDRGRATASGVYFARVRVGEASRLSKLMLVR